MENVSGGIRNASAVYTNEYDKALEKAKPLKKARDYAVAAFNGGDREQYKSEKEIEADFKSRVKQLKLSLPGASKSARNAMDSCAASSLRVDLKKIQDVQTFLAVPGLSDDHLKRYAMNSDADYGTLLMIANYGNGKSGYANRLKLALMDYEETVQTGIDRICESMQGTTNGTEQHGALELTIKNRTAQIDAAYAELERSIAGESGRKIGLMEALRLNGAKFEE